MQRIVAKWTGEALVPIGTYHKTCTENFEIGERVTIEAIEQRSLASHRMYFAAIREAWQNLPEEAAARYDSPDKLRLWALIRAGYSEETDFVFEDEQKAHAVAALCRKLDDYAIVVVKKNVVKIYRAKSQSMKSMGREQFEASKRAVLEILSGTIGVSRKALEREGKARPNDTTDRG